MNVAHPPGAPLEIAVRLIQVIVPASGRGTAKPAKSLDRQEERSMSRMLFLMPLMALATPAAAAESPAAYLGKAGAGDLFEQTSSKIVLETTRSEEHTSELQSLMRISYAVFCLKKQKYITKNNKQRINSNNK